ncbi:PulJ/GspJ family protein [Enterocloster citroniae]|uniref:Prepilin-type N-terminal cleavage/methylation domain-containing protein n=2 Tax=Enterocloster citroniae TaxID=358743 RepID=A0ABV2FVT1_9FIRM|nr:type II secretion system protein [Enterocloster citroniae]
MDNRSSKGNMTGSRGFTLLETVIALAITAMVTVFAIGFIRPQIGLYNEFDQLSQAKAMCAEAYVKLEKVLRYGYVYHADPDRPDELAYYIRKTEPYESVHESDGSVYEMLPPMDKWPRIAAGDLEVEEMDGMTLELDFGGTTSREVRALLVVKKEEEQVYEQEVVIRSMYDYEIEGDDVVGW